MTSEAPTREPRRACVITVVHQALDVRIFHKQARTLAENGWEVTLIAPAEEHEQEVEGVRVLGLPRAPRWRRPLNWLRALRLALRTRADIYHLHDPELLLITPVIRLLARRPVIYDAHEILGRNILLKEWLPAAMRPMLGCLAGVVEAILLRNTAAVICVTEPQMELFERLRRRPRLLLVGNYPVRDQYRDCASDRRGANIIFVGGLTPARGTDVLIEAFSQVKKQVPASRLWLVGPAQPPSYEAQLQERLSTTGMSADVRLFGRIPFPEVEPLLARASVGVVTYLDLGDYSYSLPTKLFEYMACGLPCVCSNIPLWARIVEEAKCGLIVDPADPKDVADAITYLLTHRREAEQMGRNGRAAFLERYTWESQAEKLLALYAQLSQQLKPGLIEGPGRKTHDDR